MHCRRCGRLNRQDAAFCDACGAELVPPEGEDPEQARFRLFDAVTTFLQRAAHDQPLVLVLDNLHWADKSSLLLLEFLAQELGRARLLVIGTYRDVEVSRQHPSLKRWGS
jgi:predicted ATPase